MKTHKRSIILPILVGLTAASLFSPVRAIRARDTGPNASNDSSLNALAGWVALDAPPGWEQAATDILSGVMPGWHRDPVGNLILRKGSGHPKRVVACSLDRPGYIVTEITTKGWLRLRESGAVRRHPLWDQFHEGQKIKVLTRGGAVPGVVTVGNVHMRRSGAEYPITTINDLWVDVGAGSDADVKRMGVEMLDPVVRDLPQWTYGNYVAGPDAGRRVGCAAVAAAARGEVKKGETIFLLAALGSYNQSGMRAALRSLGPVDELNLVDDIKASNNSAEGVVTQRTDLPPGFPKSLGVNSVSLIAPAARYKGTLVESVSLSDAERLLETICKVAGVPSPPDRAMPWIALPAPRTRQAPNDSLAEAAKLLASFADLPAVSGHEETVRQAVRAAVPAWARAQVMTDSEGNLLLSMGPDRDPVMFIAHMDEVGFEIAKISGDGVVELKSRGGLFPSSWEGQPALLHFDQRKTGSTPSAVKGIFIPRETATKKQPETLTAWFGADGKTLEGLGAQVGQSVTGYKRASRLGGARFTARSLDDRAGTTALILALSRIDHRRLSRRVIFAWSVKEETGLEGAQALANQYGNSVRRVYSVDTFVSSDTPLESSRFAYAPLGEGAVLRALDNSSVTSPTEIDRIKRIAQLNKIALQVGATNGGADGSVFVSYGVLHAGLSWPGRYSHSPVEVLDLRDLQMLAQLIYALATSPEQ
ncbi:MAG TPA: M20/M25/M40 family metallo-hydrolase [Blastocatellia bacterium]|nr:M20/M25/M40 family metallo-hydrolase [Blastocatellia bacterium]